MSLVTSAVRDALSVAKTKGSSYLADDIIIHRNDLDYVLKRVNDESKTDLVRNMMDEAIHKLQGRVLKAIDEFAGYSHVMVIG
ncbi:hypothetical protein COJ96_25895, partial [Bacillus sp. AFS073361]